MNFDSAFFHLVYYGYERTVIDSQVVTPALKLGHEGISVHLIFFEDPLIFLKLQFSKAFRSKHYLFRGLAFSVLPRIPRNIFYLNTVFLFLRLLPSFFKTSRVVLHARGLQATAAALPIKKWIRKMRVICDVRGVESEEYAYSMQQRVGLKKIVSKGWYRTLEKLAIRALTQSDVVFFVSKAMMNYYVEKIPGIKNKSLAYIPCAVDVDKFAEAELEREHMRTKLGIDDRLTVLYAGSLSSWQVPHYLPPIFSAIRKHYASAFFLGLTSEPEKLQELFKSGGISEEDFLIKTIQHEEIGNYMWCGDLALLIREKHLINRVSCPTKFAEYLASGNHILTTDAIQDFTEIIKERQVGSIIHNLEDPEGLDFDIQTAVEAVRNQSDRQDSVRVAMENFDWSLYVPVMKKWYLSPYEQA